MARDDSPLDEELRLTSRYNAAVKHPTIAVALTHLCKSHPHLRASELIREVSSLSRFPAVSVKDILGAVSAAGCPIQGVSAGHSEISKLPRPFLTYLACPSPGGRSADLFQVERTGRSHTVIWSDGVGTARIPNTELAQRWTGIVLLARDARGEGRDGVSELEDYRREVSVIDGLLTPEDCERLIAYCEAAGFSRSRVVGRSREQDVISAIARNSSSATLPDRSHPLLGKLYRGCAEREGVGVPDVEDIQCVRYKRGQRFKPHYDATTELPRLTTYLLYLNDDFEGGNTAFPLLGYEVKPKAGACLRFPSCDRMGRILWPSLHGGLPVKSGVKYALNIWVRRPVH